MSSMSYDLQYSPSAPIYPQVGNQEEQPQAQRKPATLNTNEVCVKVGHCVKDIAIRGVLSFMLFHGMMKVLGFDRDTLIDGWNETPTESDRTWHAVTVVITAISSYILVTYGIQVTRIIKH